MVIEKNVKYMTKVAIYEKRAGRQEIPMNTYYKGDYVRLNALKSAVFGTVAFVTIAVLVIVYNMEYLLANVLKMDYRQLGIRVLIAYGIWVFVYWLAARIVYSLRYEKSRPNIIIYNHYLKKLQETSKKEAVKPMAKGGVVISDDFIDF